VRQASLEGKATAALLARLRERRTEIEEAILTRVFAISALPSSGGAEYAEGLRAAVAAGVTYGLEGIEREQDDPPVPAALLAQARLAARSNVSLDTVLRRYFAGHTLLDDFTVEEAHGKRLGPATLKRLLRSQAAITDRLLAAVSDAYRQEVERRPQGIERRKAELVKRLLAGEPLEASGLGYELEGTHLGMIAAGPGAAEALRRLAAAEFDRRLLLVPADSDVLWAWLGGRRPLDPAEVLRGLAPGFAAEAILAVGEPAEGFAGWRLTHRQAAAAMPIARRGPDPVVRYADVSLLASALHDELLATSLQRIYLAPLESERDGGAALRETLLAYFESGRNVSSTAAALGVSRPTVNKRLATVERCIGISSQARVADLETALRLHVLLRSKLPPAGTI
jgi:hypothetical protein